MILSANDTRWRRVLNSKWFLSSASVVVFAFAALRGLAAWPFSAYGMSMVTFLAVDLATAYPYVYGISKIILGLRIDPWPRLILNGAIVAASFAAPYVYLYLSAGRNMPGYLTVVVLVVIFLIALMGPVRKITRAWNAN